LKSIFETIDYFFNRDPRIASQKALAAEYRWKFRRKRKYTDDVIALNDFQLFRGKPKLLKAIIHFAHKNLAGGFRVFDYHYSDFGNRSISVFEYTNPELSLHPFMIQPRGGGIKNIFGSASSPVILTTTPEFNERYQINTNDIELFKETINVDFLDHIGDHQGWTYESKDHTLIMYRHGQIIETDDMPKAIDQFIRLCDDLVNGKDLM